MIFLDTSWLVKLFVPETDAAAVRAVVAADGGVVVSELAWVEAHAAVARRRRDGTLGGRAAADVVARIRAEWQAYGVVPVTRAVVEHAADLAAAHLLRSLDAVQLASAMAVATGSPVALLFGAADGRLRDAAAAERLATPRP